MNVQEIKAAVDAGKTVYCGNDNYKVIKDSKNQYLIHCTLNDYYVGLHGLENTPYENVLNGTNFYIKQNERIEFIQLIARMTMDGEEIDGKEFVMENDDAISTLNSLIDTARDLLKTA